MENGKVSRSLEDGWDYRPDWRAVLIAGSLGTQPGGERDGLPSDEPDLVIRQVLRFHKRGTCASARAIRWAQKCHDDRLKNILAAIVQAMIVADQSREQIAARVGTTPLAITFFERLFFDVRRYLHLNEWVASVVLPTAAAGLQDRMAIKARMFMATAFHYGMRELDQVMTAAVPTSEEALEHLATKIRAAITMRAHEAMQNLAATPAGAGDVARYLEFARLPAQQDRAKQEDKLQAFGNNLMEIIHRKKAEEAAAGGDFPSRSTGLAPTQGTFSPS